MDGLINQYTIWCFVGKKYPIRTFHGQNQKKVYTRLYLNKLESIMRALSDALPTGHRAMANPTLQLHFGCGMATPPVGHSHSWPSGRKQKFLFKIGQKSYFFANKDTKTNFDAWMILQKPVLSFKCNVFLKMANLKAISSFATLILRVKTVSIHCISVRYLKQLLQFGTLQWLKFRFIISQYDYRLEIQSYQEFWGHDLQTIVHDKLLCIHIMSYVK